MFGIVTAAAGDKKQLIEGLKQAVLDLESESGDNFIGTAAGCDVEADIFGCGFKYMSEFLKINKLR